MGRNTFGNKGPTEQRGNGSSRAPLDPQHPPDPASVRPTQPPEFILELSGRESGRSR